MHYLLALKHRAKEKEKPPIYIGKITSNAPTWVSNMYDALIFHNEDDIMRALYWTALSVPLFEQVERGDRVNNLSIAWYKSAITTIPRGYIQGMEFAIVEVDIIEVNKIFARYIANFPLKTNKV